MNSSLNRTASVLTGAAVVELFPNVQILGGAETDLGFTYDLIFPHPINPDTIALIEEKMRQMIREKRALRLMEMVPFSAAELLRSKGMFERADRIEEQGEELVEIVQIGSFVDWSPGPHVEHLGQIGAFKIRVLETIEDRQIRLVGCAFLEKEEMKVFLKQCQKMEERIELQNRKISKMLKKGVDVRKKFSEGLLTSLLQMVDKKFTMLGFTHSIERIGHRQFVFVDDEMGRRREIACFSSSAGGKIDVDIDVERIVELLLEKSNGIENLVGKIED